MLKYDVFLQQKDDFYFYNGYCQNKSSAEAFLERIGGDQNPFFVVSWFYLLILIACWYFAFSEKVIFLWSSWCNIGIEMCKTNIAQYTNSNGCEICVLILVIYKAG